MLKETSNLLVLSINFEQVSSQCTSVYKIVDISGVFKLPSFALNDETKVKDYTNVTDVLGNKVCKYNYFWMELRRFKSNLPEVLCKKGAFKNFSKFTGTHLCQSLFFNEIAGLRPATLLKVRLAQAFSSEFCGTLRTSFSLKSLWWLLLYVIINPFQVSVPLLYPLETRVFLKTFARGIEMEHWSGMG